MSTAKQMRLLRAFGIALTGFLVAGWFGQLKLAGEAEQIGIREYTTRAGAGLAAGCEAPEAVVTWLAFAEVNVKVKQRCPGGKAGEGMTIRLRRFLVGWKIVEIHDWWVA